MSSPSGMPSHLSSSSDPFDLSQYLHPSSFSASPSPTFAFSPLPYDSPSPPTLSPPPPSTLLPPPLPPLDRRTTPVHRPKPFRPSASSQERAAAAEILHLRNYLAASPPRAAPYHTAPAPRRRKEGELGVRKLALGGAKARRVEGLGGTLARLQEAEERAGERRETVVWEPVGWERRELIEVARERWPEEWREKGMGAWGMSFGVLKG